MDNKSVKTNFTIEHILNCAGEQLPNTSHSSSTNEEETCETVPFLDPYSWLQCTRYCPPKIPSKIQYNLQLNGDNINLNIFLLKGVQRSRTVQKRQLGRHPRIPFTPHQLAVLEEKFKQSPYLSSEEVIELAKRLQLADIRVSNIELICLT